jgi:hypothetical protein
MPTTAKISSSAFDTLKKIGDERSVYWTPAELSSAFPQHDWKYYSRKCRSLFDNGLVARETQGDTFRYKLSNEGHKRLNGGQ